MQATPSKLRRFLLGAELIKIYDIDAELSANNGFIYIYPSAVSCSRMTESDRETMERLGWIEGDESWAFYLNRREGSRHNL